ncbi:MAG: CDP-alcohol phosphatidyltransferase family protein [Jannaschia sp.]
MTDFDVSSPADSRGRTPWTPEQPTATFALAVVASLPAIAAGAGLLGAAPDVIAVVLACFLVGTAIALGRMRARYPHPVLGACNVATLIRAALVAILAAAVLIPDALTNRPSAIPTLATAALLLDGVDGWLARRAKLASAFGARFDMEVDAVLAAVLALILARSAQVDTSLGMAALLVLGFARYAFVLAAGLLPWLRADLPERTSRKAICVVQIATLVAFLLPWPDGADMTPMAVAAAALLVWSFGRDVLWLGRRSP